MRRVTYRFAGRLDHRRDHRHLEPALTVEIDGQSFVTADWSLGGMRLEGCIEGRKPEEEVNVMFSGVRSDVLLAGEVTAAIVRIDKRARESAIRITEFHGSAFDALECLMTGRRLKIGAGEAG